ncbi:rRNA maturation RNase YbeY [Patescibacteria group bacterium]|nr:rRNA maturation RNase YbeY [Patescibacteria group bacterium]
MIEIINQTSYDIPTLQIRQLFASLFDAFGIHSKINLEIIFQGKKQIQQLNRQYRQINEPTDVLSFPQTLPTDLTLDPKFLLGSIVICPDIVKVQEKKFCYQPYLIHGFLHLMGYDHSNSLQKKEWRALEKKIINLI